MFSKKLEKVLFFDALYCISKFLVFCYLKTNIGDSSEILSLILNQIDAFIIFKRNNRFFLQQPDERDI